MFSFKVYVFDYNYWLNFIILIITLKLLGLLAYSNSGLFFYLNYLYLRVERERERN